MLNGYNGIKEFFSGDFVEVVDALARRYNKMPHEVLREISVSDFNLDLAIMIAAMKAETARSKETPAKGAKGEEKLEPHRFGLKMTTRPRTANPKSPPLMATPKFRR